MRKTLEEFTDEVKANARGNWGWILTSLAPGLKPALAKPGVHVPCPMHGGKDGFRVFKDVEQTGGGICNTCNHGDGFHDGFALLMEFTGWTFPETVQAVADRLGIGRERFEIPPVRRQPAVVTAPPPAARDPANDAALLLRLKEIWFGTLSLKHPKAEPARLYLASRRIALRAVPLSVRFHPGLSYHSDGKNLGKYPCLVVKYIAKGQAITLHRTYLSAEGTKAPVPDAKKMMMYPKGQRQLAGAAMQLDPSAPILCVGEGLETMLGVRQTTRLPTWATGTSGLLSMLDVPSVTKLLLIFADKDRTGIGLDAAKSLHQRVWTQGVQCQIHLPPLDYGPDEKGVDWNDVLVRVGETGFPDLKKYLATGT